jgi:hypothetical protein
MPQTNEVPTPPVPAVVPVKPAYTPPTVATYTDAALLDQLGPAQAGGGYNPFGGLG